MSIQTQAIIPSARNGSDLLAAIRDRYPGPVTVRPMHTGDYDIIEGNSALGPELLIHVFGPAFVREDYPDLFSDPSVLLSAECTPVHVRILRELARDHGGVFRRTDLEDWVKA